MEESPKTINKYPYIQSKIHILQENFNFITSLKLLLNDKYFSKYYKFMMKN